MGQGKLVILLRKLMRQFVKSKLHIPSGQLRLGHLPLKLSPLVRGIQRCLCHLVAEAGFLVGCGNSGGHCTGLLIGAVNCQLIKGDLRWDQDKCKQKDPAGRENTRKKNVSKACLHSAGVMLGLGHPDVKSSLLIGSCSRCIGLLVGVVDSQLVKRDLRK